ncbi:hypothetical protein ACA910_010699 [Epithemia clementina (nom. ined.)]
MSNEKGALEIVKSIREDLNKEIPLSDENADAASVERCQDLLDRLSECSMTIEILSETLIGKVVSSMKSHPVLGSKAKALVKQWKKIAKEAENQESESGTSSKAAASDGPTTTSSSTKPEKKASNTRQTTGSSVASASTQSNAESEWAGLPSLRQNMCKKFYELCLTSRETLIQDGINSEAVDQLLAPRAAEVEAALWELYINDKKGYGEKARSLVFNLRKNQPLTQQVILGQVSSEELVKLKSEELASAETRQAQAQEAKKLIDSKRLDWEQANEAKINEMCGIKGELLSASLFTCGRCKSTKTTSTQKQTRSADEPMTVFVLCLNCGKRWKC